MKTAAALVALAAIANVAVVNAQVQGQPQPTLSGCAGVAVFERCWSDASDSRAACNPGGDQQDFYSCMCKGGLFSCFLGLDLWLGTAGAYKACFAQCPDSADTAPQRGIYSNEETSYCGAVKKTTSTTTTSSSKSSTATASVTPTKTTDTAAVASATATGKSSGAFQAGPNALVGAVVMGAGAALLL
ncbi:hypothetical protein AMAG_14545 [Allomyces macrogynus ATCC 38327]|uniref:Extracellular membrane protein CFEM domain-containing protein n=1 Tax=Allomyces macrogynus (strain ATCC 38327) TaxID=578462 RepID=A0A0L0T6T0_ALLM3|nr:hypothetical protein AMAG_14545 [Allomyces macrogynus ATCC 38327]|eukprot:KNE70411.1 hypothetical protein AMAG_14545 [Allomyces macrogynus ATCC 38327]